jgi:Papain family cysteine protease/Domain of unknown function (DUF4384)
MKFILFSLLSCVAATTFAQKHAKGLIFNHSAYGKVPMKAALTRGLYVDLPASASLKPYCPIPGDQKSYLTCVGWASSYGARTILWAIKNNVTDKNVITANAFSPDFVYRSVEPTIQNCNQGTQITPALEVLQSKGDVFKRDFAQACPPNVPNHLLAQAAKHKIEGFATLFAKEADMETKIATTKKSLSENNPVVIGMQVPPSFDAVHTALWQPNESLQQSEGGHALCVVGYDDDKFGGAFEILNSWGTKWGDGGFVWVRYQDFATWTDYAFELINNIQPVEPQPVAQSDLSGNLRFVLANNTTMNASIETVRGLGVDTLIIPEGDPNLTTHKYIAYRMNQSYASRTQFRLYLSNNEPAYVYAIATDNTNKMVVLFPNKPNISPALNYKSNEVALPAENKYITMDNVKGTDVFCLLYSKEPLEIKTICRQMEAETGTFFQRLYKTLSDKLVAPEHLRYYNDSVKFEVNSHGKSVVPIVVQIPHH